MPRVDVIIHAVGETVGQHVFPATFTKSTTFAAPTINVSGTVTPAHFTKSTTFGAPTVSGQHALPVTLTHSTTFAAPTIKVSRTATPAHFTKSTTFGTPTVSTTSGGAITAGAQMNATNTGYTAFFDPALGRNLVLSDLVTTGGTTYGPGNNGQTITKKRFTDTVFVTGINITFQGCLWEVSGSAGRAIIVQSSGTNTHLRYSTLQSPSDASSMWNPVTNFDATGFLVEFCNIQRGENAISVTGGTNEIRFNYCHRSSIVSNPGGHDDLIEVFGCDSCNIHHNRLMHFHLDNFATPGADACVNIAPGACNNVFIDDNHMDGGQECVLTDVQGGGGPITNVRVRRNTMGGHQHNSMPQYHAYLDNDGVGTVETLAAQAAAPSKTLWPTSGVDANHWAECDDLSPNRNGQIVSP